MDDNGPTWQGSRWNAGNDSGGSPRWPQADQPPPFSAPRTSRLSGGMSPAALVAVLAVSIGANVALCAALIVVVALARQGALGPNGSNPLGQGTATTTTSSSPSPSISPTVASTGLQVTPNTVHLGCDNGQQTQTVLLANNGSDTVQWQASFSGSYDQSGVTLSTRHGTLRPGTNIGIKIQNASHNDGQQGTITFDTQGSGAGTPPTLSYTTDGC